MHSTGVSMFWFHKLSSEHVTLSPFSRRRLCLCLCSARAPWEGQSSPSMSTPQPWVHGSHEPGATSHHLLIAPSGWDTASQCALLSCCSHRLWGCTLPLLNVHRCVSRHPSRPPTSHPLCWPTTALTWGQHTQPLFYTWVHNDLLHFHI